MTNVEVNEDPHEPRLMMQMATHLVNQVLDEARLITNVSLETGKSWRYLLMLKHFEDINLYDTSVEQSPLAVKSDDSNFSNEACETEKNLTSTPQKSTEPGESFTDIADDEFSSKKGNNKCASEIDLISEVTLKEIKTDFGQGDVDLIPLSFRRLMNALAATPKIEKQPKYFNDTYNIIKLEICGSYEVSKPDEKESTKNPFLEEIHNIASENTENPIVDDFNVTKDDYDKFFNKILHRESAFPLDQTMNEEMKHERENEVPSSVETNQNSCNTFKDTSENDDLNDKTEERIQEIHYLQHSDVGLLERTFLTLNRDEEVGSDAASSGGVPTRLSMHEVDLFVDSTSDNHITLNCGKIKQEDDNAVKGDSLIRRCRLQGNRMCSWLRGILAKQIFLRRPRKRSRKYQKNNITPMRKQKMMSRARLYTFGPNFDTNDGTWKNVPEQCSHSRRKYLETFI